MYKSSVKEDMMRWQNSLRTHGSSDWVIIVVETNDTKKKNKTNILPRSSIVDKIRSDFCNKQSDRLAGSSCLNKLIWKDVTMCNTLTPFTMLY